MEKTGLVLEGGAMRGLFSVGVMDVLMEHKQTFDGIIGVSAGATFGCNYNSGQIGRALRYNLRFCRDWRYCSIRSLLQTGDMIGVQFCYRELPYQLDKFDFEAFNANPTPFTLVATDVHTGNPVYKELRNMSTDRMLDWIQASASMPLVSKVVRIDDGEYLDGGISDSIPLRYFREQGYQRCLVVLTQPKGFIKKPMGGMPLFRWGLRKYPRIVEALANRHEMYNAQLAYLAEQEQAGNALVIAPDEPLPIGRVEMKPEKIKLVYNMGREAATQQWEKINKFLNQNK